MATQNKYDLQHQLNINLKKLITSILVFPKMLALRPIVVDDTMTALGGNMRLRALSAISTFSLEQITNRLQGCTTKTRSLSISLCPTRITT
nr:MAG TPA: hypothetical protein [Caudoviricetes sp.]